MAHSAHNSLSARTGDFIFSHNLLCSACLKNGLVNSEMCICALFIFALQVKGYSQEITKKKKKKKKILQKKKKR